MPATSSGRTSWSTAEPIRGRFSRDPFDRLGSSLRMRWRLGADRGLAAFVFKLLVRVRSASRREIQKGPHRFDGADVPRILSRVARREQQLGSPAQPDHAVLALMEHRQDRHLLSFLILAMIIAFEAGVRG